MRCDLHLDFSSLRFFSSSFSRSTILICGSAFGFLLDSELSSRVGFVIVFYNFPRPIVFPSFPVRSFTVRSRCFSGPSSKGFFLLLRSSTFPKGESLSLELLRSFLSSVGSFLVLLAKSWMGESLSQAWLRI